MKYIVRFLARIIFSTVYRVKVVGRENVPKNGAALLCANHNSELGMFFIGFKLKRLVRWMAKEELFKNPIFGAFIRNLGAFPIKRGKGDIGSIKVGFKLLKEGHIMGIFPEGTRVKKYNPDDIKVKPGAAMFAIETGVPILPVAVEGGQKLFSKARVVIGKPYYLDAEKGKKYTSEELTEISKDIMKKVYSLLEEK